MLLLIEIILVFHSVHLHLLQSVNQLIRGNVIVSPTSIATVLALLQQGTSGEAQDQMTRALSMPPNATAPTYQRLTYDMKV